MTSIPHAVERGVVEKTGGVAEGGAGRRNHGVLLRYCVPARLPGDWRAQQDFRAAQGVGASQRFSTRWR